jgi:hypothetical protein
MEIFPWAICDVKTKHGIQKTSILSPAGASLQLVP